MRQHLAFGNWHLAVEELPSAFHWSGREMSGAKCCFSKVFRAPADNATDRQAMPETVKAGSASSLRRWPRFEADVPVRVIVRNEHKVVVIHGRGNELNEGGMAMFAGTELKPGDHVAVEFTPAYSPPIRVDARVCNRSGYTYGLEFLTDTQARKKQATTFRNHLRMITAEN
jgi:hypothetical protein